MSGNTLLIRRGKYSVFLISEPEAIHNSIKGNSIKNAKGVVACLFNYFIKT